MNVVTVKFGDPRWSGWAQDQLFSGRRIARRVSSLFWHLLGKRLDVVGENCLQEGEGLVYRKRMLNGSA